MTERVKIKCDDCKFVEDCVDYGWQGCKKFTPAPSEPQTNEEWLRSCNTEQLAEMFANESKNVIDDFVNFDFKREHKEFWERWLKQPHPNE